MGTVSSSGTGKAGWSPRGNWKRHCFPSDQQICLPDYHAEVSGCRIRESYRGLFFITIFLDHQQTLLVQ